MKHLYLFLAALFAAIALPTQAQNPFEQQTKAIYIWNVEHQKFLSDYQSPTPNTYCLQDYGPSRREAQMFEITTLNAVTGESVLYSPWTDKYMYVPAAGGFVGAKEEVEQRTVLTVKDTEDGHHLLYSGTTLLSPYPGAIMLLVGYTTAHQAAGWGKIEECKWDFVEPEDLDDFLVAHGIDPEYDPYVTPDPDPDPDPEPDPDPQPEKGSFEDLQYAILDAQAALLAARGGYVATGDGLITSADQLHSDYSDADEGYDLGYLIDEDPYSFWHSDWHGDAPEGNHALEVYLPESLKATHLIAKYTGRLSGNNCAPIEMEIYGGYKADEGYNYEDAPFVNLNRENGLGAFAGWGHSGNADVLSGSFDFEVDDLYPALRFDVLSVFSDAGEGAEACFNYSEFQLYAAEHVAPTIEADAAAVDALEELVALALTLTKSEDPAETTEEIKVATERVLGNAEGIHAITLQSSNSQYFDLQGRKAVPTKGVFISRGRKVVR